MNIPLAAFEVADVTSEYARLQALGIVFNREPTAMGRVTQTVFSDTCGSLIQIYQHA